MAAGPTRHALITGGGKGIGLAIAAALSGAGFQVSVLGRDASALEAAVSRGEAHAAFTADVTDAAAIAAAVGEAQRHAPIDILVNNAGGVETGPFLRLDDDAFERQLVLNLMSAVRTTRAVLPAMTRRGFGRIINIASTAGLKGYAYVSAYSAAKHAVIGLVRSLALEMAGSNVTVNAVCPGFTDTDLVAGSIENIMKKTGRSREQAIAELAKHNPQGRLITPQEVADAVLWLCGEGAGAITGQAIAVAGGEI